MTSITSTSPINFLPSEREIVSKDEIEKLFYEYKDLKELPEFGDTVIGDMSANVGIILIHGFSGSNVELTFLGNELARHGMRIAIPLLPGHGTNYKDLKKSNQSMWFGKVEQTYEYLKNEKSNRKIVAIGHSMGGTLALKLAEEYSELAGVISLAGPIRFSNFTRFGIKLISNMDINFPYDDLNFEDERLNDHPIVKYITENYDKVPLKSLGDLFKLMEDVYIKLPRIEMPICLIYAQNDSIIPSNQVKKIEKNVNSAKISKIWLKNSDHILVIDRDKEIVLEKILNFLKDLELLNHS